MGWAAVATTACASDSSTTPTTQGQPYADGDRAVVPREARVSPTWRPASPVGAQMFWWSGNAARHIAMYAGGGMVLTTGAFGGRVGLRTQEDMDGWGPYLGWADAYYD